MSKFTGRLKEPSIDFNTGKIDAVVQINEDFRQTYEELKNCEKLSIEFKRYRQKRSLDANAYYWVLVTKLSGVVGMSNAEIHNMILRGYGQPEIYEGKGIYLTIPDTDEARKKTDNATDYHVLPTAQVRTGDDGIVYRTYKLMRGSSTYNTAEMSRMIEGIISECKHAGIPDAEIATPDEKRLLKERYGVEI